MAEDQASKPSTTNDVAKYDLDTLVSVFNFTDRNILKLALSDEKDYSLDEAKQAINQFKGGAK